MESQGPEAKKRVRSAKRSLWAWRAQVLVFAALALTTDPDWTDPAFLLLFYLGVISVWTGIESAQARVAADKPTEE